jgi:flavorubredoxin
MKALILYWSATGNTEKIANTIKNSLAEGKIDMDVVKITEEKDVDLLEYDLVFLGSPSYQFLPPDPVLKFAKNRMKYYHEHGDIKINAPKVPGKYAVIFCTFSGPHTGVNEAIPVAKYLGQFFEHIGFEVMDEWYNVGEFHGRDLFSTEGRMGNIIGRPNEEDLAEVAKKVRELVTSISSTG